MSQITINEVEGQLVVDSRLLSEQLGIEHDTIMKNLKTYQIEIEQAFGYLRFEIGTSKPNSNGAIHETKYALLTEDQSIFILTLSRNTPKVIQCKIGLVKAFSHKKSQLNALNTLIPTPSQNYLPTRKEIRPQVTNESQIFSLYCHKWGHPVTQVHDYITLALTGMTARQLREIGWVEGTSSIGLNHIVSLETLLLVSTTKLHFARMKRKNHVEETWKERANRAIAKARKPN